MTRLPPSVKSRRPRARLIHAVLLVCSGVSLAQDTAYSDADWWAPDANRTFPARAHYSNAAGQLGVVNANGAIDTSGHAFFTALGSNGRACVTCHQPENGMSLSVESIRSRWAQTNGADPLFAAIDGMNCPNLDPELESSYSLLLNRGLFRVFLPWPPLDTEGNPVKTEFSIEVVRDPTGCNTAAGYGLDSNGEGIVSVYRRPRPVANMRYVTSDKFGVTPFNIKNGTPNARDPDTGKPVNMNMMADAREPTIRTQAQSAARTHLQFAGTLSQQQLQQIQDFELQLYAAQDIDARAGALANADGTPGLGVDTLATGRDGLLGNNTLNYVFPINQGWYGSDTEASTATDATQAFRASVARGHDVFFFRTFWITDAMHINSVGLGNPIKRTCATCHGGHLTGMDAANGWMDLGTTNLPWAQEVPLNPWSDKQPDLPLFKLTCNADVAPHPFLGRVIYTQDPGRALISGRCDDIGAIVIQQMRGLSARLPLFSNGSAQNIGELIDFYDRRFNIQFTEQERQDLANFLSTL